MKRRRNPSFVVQALVVLAAYVLSVVFIYGNSRPRRYSLTIGQVSPYDITTQKEVPDMAATESRARAAAARVNRVLTRSEEISNGAVERVESFFGLARTTRQALIDETRAIIDQLPGTVPPTPSPSPSPTPTPTPPRTTSTVQPAPGGPAVGARVPLQALGDDAEQTPLSTTPATLEQQTPILFFSPQQIARAGEALVELALEQLNVRVEQQHAEVLVRLNPTIYDSLEQQTLALARQIMDEGHDNSGLITTITARSTALVDSVQFYREEYAVVGDLLRLFLQPNLDYDPVATEAAREAEYNRSLENPIMVPLGTRLVNVGDSITADVYRQLELLDLIERPTIDWMHVAAIAGLLFFCFAMVMFYVGYYRQPERRLRSGDLIVLLVTLLLTILASAWTTRISALAVPLAFVSLVVGVYFGLRMSLGLSFLTMLAVLPLTYFDTSFLFVQTVTILVTAFVASSYHKKDNQAQLILITTLSSALAAALYGLLQKQGAFLLGQNTLYAGLTGGLSAVAAVGIMPIYELFLSTVSPIRLIQLAQPSQPLLRRLFMEAPGTNQHSMMVANLGEAAADAIGADSLLVRVGAYYHDIGKLEHPEMFTENQTDYNPHDRLSPEDSVRFIIGHVENGLRTAKRYHLPLAIQAIISEHHGNTLQASFYHKAKKLAEEKGAPAPDARQFRYPWHIPRSRESAIVSLADSLEAAMRSTGTNTIEGTEALARRIVKGKIDQDQMTDSGLSFAEIESIIRAFVQVYQGQFHERVRYPDEVKDRESTAPDGGQPAASPAAPAGAGGGDVLAEDRRSRLAGQPRGARGLD